MSRPVGTHFYYCSRFPPLQAALRSRRQHTYYHNMCHAIWHIDTPSISTSKEIIRDLINDDINDPDSSSNLDDLPTPDNSFLKVSPWWWHMLRAGCHPTQRGLWPARQHRAQHKQHRQHASQPLQIRLVHELWQQGQVFTWTPCHCPFRLLTKMISPQPPLPHKPQQCKNCSSIMMSLSRYSVDLKDLVCPRPCFSHTHHPASTIKWLAPTLWLQHQSESQHSHRTAHQSHYRLSCSERNEDDKASDTDVLLPLLKQMKQKRFPSYKTCWGSFNCCITWNSYCITLTHAPSKAERSNQSSMQWLLKSEGPRRKAPWLSRPMPPSLAPKQNKIRGSG